MPTLKGPLRRDLALKAAELQPVDLPRRSVKAWEEPIDLRKERPRLREEPTRWRNWPAKETGWGRGVSAVPRLAAMAACSASRRKNSPTTSPHLRSDELR